MLIGLARKVFKERNEILEGLALRFTTGTALVTTQIQVSTSLS